jgi:hypothetical protein
VPDKKFDLGEYVEVKDRIKLLYELFANGRLVTEAVEILTAPDGKQRVMVRAAAYRTPDDPHPGIGHSWLELPGTTPYTRGSEVENAETSAWGRAIAALGILVDRSIASAQEVANKQDDAPRESRYGPLSDGGLVGIAEVGKPPSDFELRTGPDGSAISFRLVQGRQSIKVVAKGPLADALVVVRADLIGTRVTCWGTVTEEAFVKDGKTIAYRVLTLERLQSPDYLLPGHDAVDAELAALPMFTSNTETGMGFPE